MATLKPVSEKSLVVLNYLKENADANLTSGDIAEALGLEKKTVDGIVTAGTDVAVITIGKVCDELGLTGLSFEAAQIASLYRR